MNLYPFSSQHKRFLQDIDYTGQRQALFEFLQTGVYTTSEAAAAINIARKSLTRFKRQLEMQGKLWEVKETICSITGNPAMLITTNPVLVPRLIVQGSIFEKEAAHA